MAESRSVTTSEVVAKTPIAEHGDFLSEGVAMIAAEIMEAEISAQIGAGKGEVAETRSTHRNGYRQRPWATRVGEIELAVPRKRSDESYFPSFLEPRKRSEKALLGVVMEAYVNGVSTRKVDHLVAEFDRTAVAALGPRRRRRTGQGDSLVAPRSSTGGGSGVRSDGGIIEVEGSTPGASRASLRLSSTLALSYCRFAEVYARATAEPDRLAKMHFAHTERGWKFVYGLDVDALPVMVIALSGDDYAKALDEAKGASKPPAP
jgi:hypothetical protein